MNLQELGEFPFIESIKENAVFNPSGLVVGIGDDCAVYQATLGYEQVVTIDTMVENVHFSFRTMSPFDVGYRLTAANLSDLAAMGAKPRQVLISVAAYKQLDVNMLKNIYEGIKTLCQEFEVNLIGGDTVKTEGPLVLTMTAIGEVPSNSAVLRSGAKSGDYIGVTGYIGSSAVGLAVLQEKRKNYSYSKEVHQRPRPQLTIGEALRKEGVHAMNDISDGLASELYEIAEASHKQLYIEWEKIPLHEETILWAREKAVAPQEFALFGGEDFQLVFTFPENLLSLIEKHEDITIIGRVGAEGKEVFIQRDEERLLLHKKGYSHF